MAKSDEEVALNILSEIAQSMHTVLLEGGKVTDRRRKARLWRLLDLWQKHPLHSQYLNCRNDVGYIA